MGFKDRNFDELAYKSAALDPKKLIIISCEGSNTEPEYFQTIKDKLSTHISSLIEIELVSKQTEASEPKDVLDNLARHVEKYDIKKGYDSLWLVCDREKVEGRKTGSKGLLHIKPQCDEFGYSIALINPLFEFWLLLHIVDISEYDHKTLFENEKVNKSRRYIDKVLSNLLEGGFNKKSGRFNKSIVTLDNIQRAIDQEATFETEFDKIIDNLGSNVGSLVKDILDS